MFIRSRIFIVKTICKILRLSPYILYGCDNINNKIDDIMEQLDESLSKKVRIRGPNKFNVN